MNAKIIINFVLFQIVWFACVIGASKAMPFLGVIATFAVLAWHFYQAHEIKLEIGTILSTLIIGATFDQCILSYHLVDYTAHGWSTQILPVWILALWLGFASTLNVSLRWMRGKHLVAVIFGAIGGPLAYIAAEKLGAVILHGNASYIALSVGWGIITPLLLVIASRYDGFK